VVDEANVGCVSYKPQHVRRTSRKSAKPAMKREEKNIVYIHSMTCENLLSTEKPKSVRMPKKV
jgi:hypothetical protein